MESGVDVKDKCSILVFTMRSTASAPVCCCCISRKLPPEFFSETLLYSLHPIEWMVTLIGYFLAPQFRVNFEITNSDETMISFQPRSNHELEAINVIKPPLLRILCVCIQYEYAHLYEYG